MSAGIDYSLGRANRDPNNPSLHYGVIAMSAIDADCFDDLLDPDYGDPRCPECENLVVDSTDPIANSGRADEAESKGCRDYYCESCNLFLDSGYCFPDEPIGWNATSNAGYTLTDCLDTNIMVLRSPYYTLARYCSPCVPGAGDLETPDPDGIKTYCLGHDCFNGNRAPYPVYAVADDSLIQPGNDTDTDTDN